MVLPCWRDDENGQILGTALLQFRRRYTVLPRDPATPVRGACPTEQVLTETRAHVFTPVQSASNWRSRKQPRKEPERGRAARPCGGMLLTVKGKGVLTPRRG